MELGVNGLSAHGVESGIPEGNHDSGVAATVEGIDRPIGIGAQEVANVEGRSEKDEGIDENHAHKPGQSDLELLGKLPLDIDGNRVDNEVHEG